MASIQITVDDKSKGVTELLSKVNTISEALDNATMIARIAPAVRLLHNAAKEDGAKPVSQLPSEDTAVFVCGCGELFTDSGAACTHVEANHANDDIRQDLERLETLIDFMVVPSPLTEFPDNPIPVRSYAGELEQELIGVFQDLYRDNYDNLIGCQATRRAKKVIKAAHWDEVKGFSFYNYKEQIVLFQNDGSAKPVIKPAVQEDFLLAYALLLRQVGGVLKGK